MSIALIVNPRSRVNRLHPERIGRLVAALHGAGRILAAGDLERQSAEIRSLARDRPTIVAVHGGDGTLHQALSVLIPAWGDGPLPMIATLPGGTMNVVASSLGIAADPVDTLESLSELERRGRRPAVIRRRCLHVGDRYGFVFGNGYVASFLTEYYSRGAYSPARALYLAARMFGSAAMQGDFSRRLLQPFVGTVEVDGRRIPRERHSTISAGTVREVGLGFKLNFRADENIDRFSLLAIHAGPLELCLDVPLVFAGRGVSPTRAESFLAERAVLEPAPGTTMPYTIDGDLYSTSERLEVALGPVLEIVRPPRRD